MNIMAFVLAVIGLVGIVAGFNLNKLVKNKYLGGVLQLIGVFVAILIMSLLAPDAQTSAQAGNYLVYLAIPTLVIKFLFFKKKKQPDHEET